MTPIIIDNAIKLKTDFNYIEINVLVPRLNIQNMLDQTAGKLLSKTPTTVHFNHHAGQLYMCRIRVQLKKG